MDAKSWIRLSVGDTSLMGEVLLDVLADLLQKPWDKLPAMTRLEHAAVISTDPNPHSPDGPPITRFMPVGNKGSDGVMYVRTDLFRTVTPIETGSKSIQELVAHYSGIIPVSGAAGITGGMRTR